MKIALVSPYEINHYGGVNGHVGSLAAEFTGQGHDVTIMAPCNVRTNEIWGIPFFSLGRAVPVHTAGSVAQLSPAIWKHWQIRRFLRDEAFDVVHVHEPFSPIPVYQVVLASNTLTIGTFHAYNSATRRLRIWKRVLLPIYNALDGRIAVSEASKEFVATHFPGEYEVIPNGIEIEHFAKTRSRLPEFDDGKVNILFVGRAEVRKGLKYLIGAFSLLKWEMPNIRLIVVGPGNPDQDSARYMAERGVGDDICFVGSPSYEDLPSYHHSADIFCTASIDRESFGYVVAESMAAGLPIVATDIAGHRSVVGDRGNALMVPPKDEAALAGALRTLIEDPALRERLGKAAREKAEEYRWSRVSSLIYDYYQSTAAAVGNGRSGAGFPAP
ncbi:MAG: glycosyltransferase family 4 protein [Chloroflexi bacterium]|nr:glycosyltransferase family 4 protein [Chloroflexota bacterium]